MTTAKEPLLYASVPADIYVGPSDAMLALRDSDEIVVVGREVAHIFEQCAVPRTLEEQIARGVGALRLDSRAPIQTIVDALVQIGLLVSMERVPNADVAPARAVETLVIPTSDRADVLKRCVVSYAARCEQWGQSPTVWVFDGSQTPNGAAATQAVCRSETRGAHVVRYFGLSERERVRTECIGAGFDAEIVRWLLPDPPSVHATGATRNLALLATAGQSVLTIGDDTSAEVRERAGRRAGLTFVGHIDARDTDWFETRHESTHAGAPSAVDLLASHGALLGTRLANIGQPTQPIDFSNACKHLLREIHGRASGRIRATWSGVAGDGGAYCPYGVLFVQGRVRDRLADSLQLFQRALKSREVFQAVHQVTVTDDERFMGYCAGLDNRDLLPPFSPTGFNEDGLFGWLLRAIDPSAFIAQLPYAVVHDSSLGSIYDNAPILSAAQVRTAEVIEWLCRPWALACVSATPANRLKSLGGFLCELGELSVDTFRHHLKKTVVEAKWQAVRRCEPMPTDGFVYPDFWRRAFLEYKTALFDSFAVPEFYLPIEWQVPAVCDKIGAFQRHLQLLGRAMIVWPELWGHFRAAGPAEDKWRS